MVNISRPPLIQLLVVIAGMVVITAVLISREDPPDTPQPLTEQPGVPEYVGSTRCLDCHQEQMDVWLQSDHFHAMNTYITANGGFSVTFDNSEKFTDGPYHIYRTQSFIHTNIFNSLLRMHLYLF